MTENRLRGTDELLRGVTLELMQKVASELSMMNSTRMTYAVQLIGMDPGYEYRIIIDNPMRTPKIAHGMIAVNGVCKITQERSWLIGTHTVYTLDITINYSLIPGIDPSIIKALFRQKEVFVRHTPLEPRKVQINFGKAI